MADFTQPADYWGVSPQTAASFPLGLRTSNNLFNIKYFPGAERDQSRWPGLLGPSSARDQGDPQMLFRNPEDSGVAAAGLLQRKYASGMTTPQQIIAGPQGWTPGHQLAPGAVARNAGVGINDDLKLDTPEGLRRMLPALATQEHGQWMADRHFTPAMWDKIAERATGAQFATGELPKLSALDLEKGSNAHRWPDGAVRPGQSTAPMNSTAPQGGAQRMASPFDQQQPESGVLDSLVQRFNAPMTQQGFGLLLSAMQGGDLNKGMSAGAERGQMALQQQMAARKQREEDERKRAISQMLQDPNSMQGVPQGLVNIARATQNVDPISQYYAKQGGTDDIREYEYAIRSGFKGDFTSWMNQKRAHAGGEYAKQLVYGTDAKGNVVPMQAGSRGDLVASKMPEGVQMQRDPIKFDAGTHFVLMDPTTRQPIGMVPKNLSGVEIEKGAGETIAKARAGLPQAEQAFGDTVQLLDKIRAHPGLPYSVGAPSYIPPIHGTSVRDFVSMFDQAKGGAFLRAAEKMRGLGALTEKEGEKAEAAIARMNRGQSQAAFLDALKDYQHIMDRGLATMRAQAQIGQQPGMPQQQPAAPIGGPGWKAERIMGAP